MSGQEPEKTKEEVFAENPERFEDMKNCLLVVKRDPESNKIMILNQCKDVEENMIVEGYIRDGMAAHRNALRIRAANTASIIKPKGNGFFNGLRNMKK